MQLLKGLLKQLRAVFRKRRVEREMDDEMAFHLEMETQANLRKGMSPEEARRSALLSFGGVERYKEQVRDARWTRIGEDLLSDARHAFRRLFRRPTFSLTVVFTLGLGLAATGAAYGIAYGVLLRPLPYPDGDELVRVWQSLPGWSRFPVSFPAYDRWRTETSSFTELAAYDDAELIITGGAESERVLATPSTANLVTVLGVRPLRGRWFTELEDAAGSAVAVVSHEFWATRLGSDPGVLGSVVRLDDEPYEIVGVMPPGMTFPSPRNELWLPLGPEARTGGWNSQSFEVVGRLAPGVDAASADADLGSATARFVAEGLGPEVGSRVVQLREDVVGSVQRTLLLALAAAVAVLLIAALNVANLFLARGSTARPQAGVRMALGAGRTRLTRELAMEGVIVATIGAAVGLVAAASSRQLVVRALAGRIPRLDEVAVDAPVIMAVLGVAAVIGVLLGLVASWAATSGGVSAASLGSGSRGTGRGARLFRSTMVAGQVAAVLVLLSAAGLFVRSLDHLVSVDRGFDETRTLALVEPVLVEGRYPDDEARIALFRRLVDRVESVPGVTTAAAVAPLPFSGSERNTTLTPLGWEDGIGVGLTEGTEGAFETLGIPLLAGRGLRAGDATAAVVSEGLADLLESDGAVLGRTLPLDGATVEVVGIVGDIRQEGLADPPVPRIWVPFGWSPDDDTSLVIASSGTAAALQPTVRAALVEEEPALAGEPLLTMTALVQSTASFPRFRAALVLVLALAAAGLAGVGIYGVTSYSVIEQRKELSIRTALGARGPRVVAEVLGRELRVVALGLAAGLPLAVLTGRAVSGFLYEVSPGDPSIHVSAVLGVLTAAALAVLVPALRAVRTNPADALRMDERG